MRVFLALMVSALFFVACSSNRIYIVRHAEKSVSPANDPDLTPEGKARAEALEKLLRKKDIQAIHSTNTRRTRQTAEPLALATGLPIQTYTNDSLLQFLYRVVDSEKNTLIVGHSNTVPRMLRELSLPATIQSIPDNDYDNLFVIIVKSKSGPAGYELKLKERTYGKKSPNTRDTSRQVNRMQ